MIIVRPDRKGCALLTPRHMWMPFQMGRPSPKTARGSPSDYLSVDPGDLSSLENPGSLAAIGGVLPAQ